jgi:hypothetical protein
LYTPASDLKAPSTDVASRPRLMPFANSFDVIMGVSVSATTAENTTAAATDTPNSPNSLPTLPCRYEMGRKTATSTRVVATTAKVISRLPFIAASSGCSPCSMRRTMFSSTTMASSTTRPMASTAPSSVSVLME